MTKKNLDELVDSLNALTGSPRETYVRNKDGMLEPQEGNFHIDNSYGGVQLVRMSRGGGVFCPIGEGRHSKRELAERITIYSRGMLVGRSEC